jgi:hypothetical protein
MIALLEIVFGRGKREEPKTSGNILIADEENPELADVVRIYNHIPETFKRIGKNGTNPYTFVEDTGVLAHGEQRQRGEHAPWFIEFIHDCHDSHLSPEARQRLKGLGKRTFDRFNLKYAEGVTKYFDNLKISMEQFDEKNKTGFAKSFADARAYTEVPGSVNEVDDVLRSTPIYMARPFSESEEARVKDGSEERKVRVEFGNIYPVILDMFNVSRAGVWYAENFSRDINHLFEV